MKIYEAGHMLPYNYMDTIYRTINRVITLNNLCTLHCKQQFGKIDGSSFVINIYPHGRTPILTLTF